MDVAEWVRPITGDLISPRICHALGALTINWNLCEDCQTNIIHAVANSDWVTMELVLANMPNNSRATLLTDLCEDNIKDKTLKSAVTTFGNHFSINLENRNILVHSIAFPLNYSTEQEMKFVRLRRRYGSSDQFLDCTTDLVEGVVRDAKNLFIYGTAIYQKIRLGAQIELPPPPPKPRKLMEAFQVGEDALRRPNL